MNFILDFLSSILEYLSDGFSKLFSLIAKPLSYVFYFFEGIFHFVAVLFDVVVKVVMIFVALFQFLGALALGFMRTLQYLLVPTFNTSTVHLPSNSSQGLNVILDLVAPTGVLTVVPYICLAVIWFVFVMKIFALFSTGAKG